MVDERARGLRVTIKAGAAEMEFAGSAAEVSADIITAFGMTPSDFDGPGSLGHVVSAAGSIVQGTTPLVVANGLGGSLVKEEATSAPSPAPAPAESKWSGVAAKDLAPNPDEALIAEIGKAPSKDALRAIMKKNQAALTRPEVKAAVKARGEALAA